MSAMMLLVLVLIIVEMFLGLCKAHCEWDVSISRSLNLSERVPYIMQHHDHPDITNMINQFSKFCLKDGSQVKFTAYSYNLLLEVDCRSHGLSETDAVRMAEGVIRQGPQPHIKICTRNSRRGNYAHVCRLYGAILMQLQPGDDGCSTCALAWVVPIQWDHIAPQLNVYIDNSHSNIKPKRLTLEIQGYHWLNSVPVVNMNISEIPDKPIATLFLPGKSALMVLGPLLPDQAVYLSYDYFRSAVRLQLSEIGGEQSVCPCMENSPYILKTAVLSSRILVLTKAGVFELFNSLTTDPGTVSLIHRHCSRDLEIPRQSLAFQQQVVLVGACSDEGKIYAATIDNFKYDSLVFMQLTSTSSMGPCDMLNIPVCHIISCVSSAFNAGVILCLTRSNDYYHLTSFSGADWEVINIFPISIKVAPYSDKPQPMSWYEPVAGEMVDLVLNQIVLSSHVSRQIYLTGRHIVHSVDWGESFYLMPWNIAGNVTLVVMSMDDHMVLITSSNEIWVTEVGSVKLRLIYPSHIWSMMNSILGLAPLAEPITIVSAFFDSYNKLQLMVLENDMIVKREVPLMEILQVAAAQEHWHMTALGSNVIGLSDPCVFNSMHFSLPSHIKYTRIELSSYRAPSPLHKEPLHSYKLLIAYHALLWNLEMYENDEYVKSRSTIGLYGFGYTSLIDKWKTSHNSSQPFYKFLYMNGMLDDGIYVDLDLYHRIFEEADSTNNEKAGVIHLDFNTSYIFFVYYQLGEKPSHDPLRSMDLISLTGVSSDPDHLLVFTEREDMFHNNTVKYQVVVKDAGRRTFQNTPGMNEISGSVQFSVARAPLMCLKNINNQVVSQNLFTLDVQTGCSPGQYVVFDWQSSWDHLLHSKIMELPYDCLNVDPNLPCFYFYNTFYPYFSIYDDATGVVKRFMGNYTLKIIGGKEQSSDTLEMFDEQTIINMNKMFGTDLEQALVWSPLDEAQALYDGWPIYNSTTNGISWLCQEWSPCSSIMPDFPSVPEFFFLFEFSNRVVDHESYCDYTQTFIVHVHGLPISNTSTSIILVLVCMIITSAQVVLYYVCHRNKSGLWNHLFASTATRIRAFYQRLRSPIEPIQPPKPQPETKIIESVDEYEDDQSFSISHDEIIESVDEYEDDQRFNITHDVIEKHRMSIMKERTAEMKEMDVIMQKNVLKENDVLNEKMPVMKDRMSMKEWTAVMKDKTAKIQPLASSSEPERAVNVRDSDLCDVQVVSAALSIVHQAVKKGSDEYVKSLNNAKQKKTKKVQVSPSDATFLEKCTITETTDFFPSQQPTPSKPSQSTGNREAVFSRNNNGNMTLEKLLPDKPVTRLNVCTPLPVIRTYPPETPIIGTNVAMMNTTRHSTVLQPPSSPTPDQLDDI